MSSSRRAAADPITLELIKNALDAIVDEMAIALVRTAYSNNLKNSMDMSCALCDAEGRLIAQGLTLPLHLGSVPDAMAAVKRKFQGKIRPGDVFILNDPFEGGTHLPDFYILKPIHVGTDLVGWSVSIGHQLDVGLVCEMRSSTDNFSGSNVLEATGAILQPGFVMWAPSGIASRYGRLLLTGTNQVIPWYACVMPCWLETALQAADIGYEEKTRESQVRNESDFGVVNVFNLTAGGRRSLKLSFRANSPGAAEIRNELVWRSRGGAYPAAIMPRSDEGSVYLGRFTDEWGVKRAFLETWDTDLFLAEDAVVAPLLT